jgi:hypothetical protein
MRGNPRQRFFDNQWRRPTRHNFNGLKAKHHIYSTTDQVNVGRRMILLAQLNAVFVAKSVFSRHA